jgi:mannose-6-phosphate isomerase-like protein (cupin superfamily)
MTGQATSSHPLTRWTSGTAMPWQVLAGARATGGKFLIGEVRLQPGDPCPAQHVHAHEHEAVYVVEGVLTVELGDERLDVHAGECLVMPPGVPHRFGNLSDGPVRVIGTVAPTAIEQMYEAEEAYFSGLDGPPDPDAMAAIVEPYDIAVVGPPLGRGR